MNESDVTLVALDVDGVLNSFTTNPRARLVSAKIGSWTIRWRPELLARIRALLALPGVDGAWLTTWLEEPWLLDELERALGLDGLVPHRADHPSVQTRSGGFIIDERFTADSSVSSSSGAWWKLRAAELLIERLQPARFAWLDDELGRAGGGRGGLWRLGQTSERLLLRPDAIEGVMPSDLDRLETWVTGVIGARDVTRLLASVLGPTLVAGLAGVKDVNLIREWVTGGGVEPQFEEAKRIAFAYELWRTVADVEGDGVVRAWFVGLNPWLNERTPVTAIREGHLDAARVAAQALIDDSFSG